MYSQENKKARTGLNLECQHKCLEAHKKSLHVPVYEIREKENSPSNLLKIKKTGVFGKLT